MASGSRGRGGAQVLCKYHPDAMLVEDAHAGDMICTECGLVVVERCIDVGSEWRTFGSDKDAKDNSRVGAAENGLLDGADLSTTISVGTGSASFGEDGKPLYSSKRNNMSSSDRALLSAFREIAQMADRLNLPSMIVDRADTLFKQVHVTKTLKGRSNDAIASACLYIACRKEGVPRTFKEICAVSKISKKEIGRVFKLILKNLATSVELVTTSDFMSRFCANLGLATNIQRAAMEIARKASEIDIVPGRSPVSVAAAAIYLASQASEDKRQAKDIGEVAGVAEVTIKQTYRVLLPRAHELFPKEFKFTTSIENLPTQ